MVAAIALLLACGDAGVDPPPPEPADAAELQRLVDSTIVALGIPGAVVGVREAGGAETLIASGVDDLASGHAMDVRDRFRVGSVTKAMVATVALQLVDEGRLRLSDSLAHWLPGIVPGARIITVRQLLDHTSGLADYADDAAFASDVRANPARAWAPAELVTAANRAGPVYAPGTPDRWAFAHTNYVLLGLVLERAAGEPLGTLLGRRLLGPLGLANTWLAADPGTPAPFSRGYVDAAGAPAADVAGLVHPSATWAAGAAVSDARDLLALAEAVAAGTLLSAPTQRERIRPVAASGLAGYGLGVQTFGHWVGHAGEFPGYETRMYARPGVGAIVVLTNRTTDGGLGSARLFAAVRWAVFRGR